MTAPRFPQNASLYEAVRTHPAAKDRLSAVGLTKDYYDYRIEDAARAVGVPVEELSAILAEPEPAETVEVVEVEVILIG